jgi:hypothetical protein
MKDACGQTSRWVAVHTRVDRLGRASASKRNKKSAEVMMSVNEWNDDLLWAWLRPFCDGEVKVYYGRAAR